MPSEKQPLEDMIYQIATVSVKLQGVTALVFCAKELLNAADRRPDPTGRLHQGIATLLDEVEMIPNEVRHRLQSLVLEMKRRPQPADPKAEPDGHALDLN